MISDRSLLRLSLVISLIGIVALFVFVQIAQPLKISVSEIYESMAGKNVEVIGTIESYSVKEGNVFLQITDGKKRVNVVMFERDAKKNSEIYNLQEGQNASIKGKISIYRSELEIIADSITGF